MGSILFIDASPLMPNTPSEASLDIALVMFGCKLQEPHSHGLKF